MSDLRVLVIDDLRMAKEPGATHCITADEGIIALATKEWDYILLDHDLGIDETGKVLTIWPVIEYICLNPAYYREVMIDIISSNPVGAQQMRNALEGALGVDIFVWPEEAKRHYFDYRPWEDMTGW
jgi:hypothetical protein